MAGEPPMTGSATLLLHVLDQNDNVPKLSVNHVVMCVGDGPTMTNLTALDPDNEPFGGPFIFELLGEVKGKWSVNPSYGEELMTGRKQEGQTNGRKCILTRNNAFLSPFPQATK